eukprot:Seg1079.7 transcript_id=Seg1079.7/GoldUCD/mRNA.D3Y31 product="E3 ubiquitin-protein ligase ZSWIM2" protein_id=Seg1079.7/GoldUCD/D3Y31
MGPLTENFKQSGWVTVAAPTALYATSLACGMCVKVEASGHGSGAKPLPSLSYAVVTNECPSCGNKNDLDFALTGDGRWGISFTAIDCPVVSGTPGHIKFKLQGSSVWYLKLQVANARIPTADLQVYHDSAWRCISRVADNFFVAASLTNLPMKFPLKVKFTSIAGETLTAFLNTTVNNVYHETGVQYQSLNQYAAGKSSLVLPCSGTVALSNPAVRQNVTQPPPVVTTVPASNRASVNSSKVVCTKDHIGYDLPTQIYNSSTYSSISLRDPACKPTSGPVTMKLRADLGNTCGTTIRETSTHFIYENEVVFGSRNASTSNSSNMITRSGHKNIAFSCSYEKWGMAMNGPGFSVRSVMTNVTEAGFGTFSLKFEMFKDVEFTTKYSSFPVLVSLRDRLHFEIISDVSDRSILLLIDSCYATPSNNDKDNVKYIVIKDRCPSDTTLKFHSPSGKPHAQRFSIEAFKFLTNSSTVYMHCKVFLCKRGSSDSRCNGGCAGNNLQRAKRSIQKRSTNEFKSVSKIYQLAAGPIEQKPSAAVLFQKALVEREINEIIQGVHVQRKVNVKGAEESNAGKNELPAKSIDEEDVCPICQEEFLECKEPLTHCRYGCGNNIHIKCMKVWAQHRKSDGDSMIKCPLCRSDFGTFQEIIQEFHKLSSKPRRKIETADVHIGATCQHCRLSPIQGKCYRCVVCLDFHLCQECFGKDIHVKHSFQFRKNTNQRWRPAPRNQNANIMIGIAENLQDGNSQVSQVTGSRGLIPSEKLHEDSDEIERRLQCQICCASFRDSDNVRKLACKHTFHKFCIDDWMSRGSNVCPLDGQKLASRSNRVLQEPDTLSTNTKGSEVSNENTGLTILGINSVHRMVIKPPRAPTQSCRRSRHSVSSVDGITVDLNDLMVNGSSRRSTQHESEDSPSPFQAQRRAKKTSVSHNSAGNRSAPNTSSGRINTLPPIHPTASHPRSQSGDQLNRRHRALAIVSPSSELHCHGTQGLSVGRGAAVVNCSDFATRSTQNTKRGQLVKKGLSGLTASSISTSEPNLSSLIDVFQVGRVTTLRDLDQTGT